VGTPISGLAAISRGAFTGLPSEIGTFAVSLARHYLDM
jgi:hypothetical protein